jgi:outer membrane receptor protein involved in Fe transport
VFSPSVSLGYNTKATFRNRLTYRGSSTDWLGFDNGRRALPDGIPSYKLARNAKKPDGTLVGNDELERYGERVNTYMSARRAVTPPNFGVNLVVGNGWDLGEGRAIGFLGALTYSRNFTLREEIYREYRLNGDQLARNVDFNLETGNDAVTAGAFASVTYAFARGQRLTLIGMHNQLSDNSAKYTDGIQPVGEVAARHVTRLSFVSRQLSYAQLKGKHEFKDLNRANLEWNVSISGAGRNEPNTRDAVWEYDPSATSHDFHYAGNNPAAGRHLWADQSETAYGAGLDITQPLLLAPKEVKVKLGGLLSLRDRSFTARRLHYELSGSRALAPPLVCQGPGFDESCNDALFTNDSIGPLIRLADSTLPTDAYNATLNIYAAYFMGDISLTKNVRLVGGERLEVTRQTINPFDQFNTGAKITGANLRSTDLLPSVGLIVDLSKKIKIRAAASRTLARPQLRELAPYAFDDVVGG